MIGMKKGNKKIFLNIIDQLYNSVYTDISNFENFELSLDRQIELINQFINKNKEISKQSISELFYLDTYGIIPIQNLKCYLKN